MASFVIEDQYGNYMIAGADEVGRGSWVGPIVAGAVIINRKYDCSQFNDSKTLTKSNLCKFSKQIFTEHVCGIGVVDIAEINQLNINVATGIAMTRAIANLPANPTMILVDGNIKLQTDIQTQNVIKGDSISVSIAAASIIAKVYRDEYMTRLALDFPEYFWQQNVGYGTKQHSEQIAKHGVSMHHRINYKPIKKFLEQGALHDNK